jgi:hypothetical protein
MARSKVMHAALRPDTFAGAVKLRCDELNITLTQLAPVCGVKPDTIRARLSKSRGKRSLQPHQVTRIAAFLRMDVRRLHALAAPHEGWIVDAAAPAPRKGATHD